MKSVGIVGAGQSGLQLAIGLRQAGYPVVLLSALTPEQIRNGRVTSSQCMFGTALEHERRLGLNHWDELCPAIDGIEFAVAGGRVLSRRCVGMLGSNALRGRWTSASRCRG